MARACGDGCGGRLYRFAIKSVLYALRCSNRRCKCNTVLETCSLVALVMLRKMMITFVVRNYSCCGNAVQ